jgi:signal transduction histidine kinase
MDLAQTSHFPGLAAGPPRRAVVPSGAKGRHITIQSKLLFGFAIITSLTVLATSVAFFSSRSLGAKLSQIESKSLPPLMELHSISRQASALSALSGDIARAGSTGELNKALGLVVETRSAMIANLMALPASPDGAARDTLRSLIEDLVESAVLLGNSTAERIRLRSEGLSLTDEAIKAHRKVYETLASLFDDANFSLTIGLRQSAGDGSPQKNKSLLTASAEKDLPTLVALSDLRAETNLIIGILSEISLAVERAQLVPLRDRLLASTHRAQRALTALSSHPGAKDIGAALEGLLAFTAANSILAVRDRELAADEEGWRLVRDCRAKGESLASAAERAAEQSREAVSQAVAASSAEVVIYSVALALLLVSSVIVLFSAFLFIRRDITARLQRLSSAIRTIAGGDLSISVPCDGHDELGEMGAAVETFKANASKLLELEAEQSRMLVHAEQALKAKSEFLSNMSHELRTPMHAVLSYAKMGFTFIGETEIATLETYFRNIHTAGSRLLGLLNNLLDLAKLESGKMNFKKIRGDFIGVLEHAKIEISPLIEDKKLTLLTEIATADSQAVFDKQRMVQVIINLISNAVKFSSPGGNIVVTLSDGYLPDGEDALCCSVADEGTGIPEAELEAVFDKFIQSSKTKTGAGGTGLGLSICREIIEAHRGKISAGNREPKGVVISFVIPRNEAQQVN